MCHSGKSHGLNKIKVTNFFSAISNLVLPQQVYFNQILNFYVKYTSKNKD